MNKKIGVTPLFILLVFSSLFGQKTKINYQEYDLANGLHVILQEDHSTPNVVVSVMYHVGSKDEDTARTGFAHFFEHLLFEGSDNIARGEFDQYVERAGGVLNANTSQDRTYYYELLPSNQLKLGLWLESERMMHAKVEKIGIETQRQVVKEEKRMRVDNKPYGSLMTEIFKRAFTKHPYRWQPIGSMAHLDAAQESDYQYFYKTFYVPNNACLSIAGDINMEETKTWIKQYFETIPAGKPVVRQTHLEPMSKVEIRDVYYDNIQLPAVIHAYRGPKQNSQDAYALEMLGMVLNSGASSRLEKKLVSEKELAVASASFLFPLEDPGLFISYAIANTEIDAETLEKSMDEEYEKISEELISDAELEKVRNIIRNRILSQQASIAQRAEALANFYTFYGSTDLINTEIDKYLSVTKEDILRVARLYLQKSNRVALYYLPMDKQNQN